MYQTILRYFLEIKIISEVLTESKIAKILIRLLPNYPILGIPEPNRTDIQNVQGHWVLDDRDSYLTKCSDMAPEARRPMKLKKLKRQSSIVVSLIPKAYPICAKLFETVTPEPMPRK